jgi:hypothetical protein
LRDPYKLLNQNTKKVLKEGFMKKILFLVAGLLVFAMLALGVSAKSPTLESNSLNEISGKGKPWVGWTLNGKIYMKGKVASNGVDFWGKIYTVKGGKWKDTGQMLYGKHKKGKIKAILDKGYIKKEIEGKFKWNYFKGLYDWSMWDKKGFTQRGEASYW